jgi:hypothetical protein
MKPHPFRRCGASCWSVVASLRDLNGQNPPTFSPHQCEIHDVRLGAFCRACELPQEAPRSQRAPANGHGFVACAACHTIVLVCPLGEAQDGLELNERARHPAAVSA